MEEKYAPFVRKDLKYFNFWFLLPFAMTFWFRFSMIAIIIINYTIYGTLLMVTHKRGTPMPSWKRWMIIWPKWFARCLVWWGGISWVKSERP
jgi:hypothetical protein